MTCNDYLANIDYEAYGLTVYRDIHCRHKVLHGKSRPPLVTP